MNTSGQFATGIVLEYMSGKIIYPPTDGIGNGRIIDLTEFILGRSVSGFYPTRGEVETCRQALREQHPWLSEITPPSSEEIKQDPDCLRKWAYDLASQHGRNLTVQQLA